MIKHSLQQHSTAFIPPQSQHMHTYFLVEQQIIIESETDNGTSENYSTQKRKVIFQIKSDIDL